MIFDTKKEESSMDTEMRILYLKILAFIVNKGAVIKGSQFSKAAMLHSGRGGASALQPG